MRICYRSRRTLLYYHYVLDDTDVAEMWKSIEPFFLRVRLFKHDTALRRICQLVAVQLTELLCRSELRPKLTCSINLSLAYVTIENTQKIFSKQNVYGICLVFLLSTFIRCGNFGFHSESMLDPKASGSSLLC